jgi:hypothetical protein
MKFTVRLLLANGNLYCIFLLKTPNRQRSRVWKIWTVEVEKWSLSRYGPSKLREPLVS